MGENTDYLGIIKQAQLGSEDDISRLTTEARQRVFVYIYRVTLDYHLTQDLSQDTVLEMIKSLKRLKIENVNSFWSWLYRTALGKIQHHFRYQGNRKIEQKTIADGSELLNLVPQNCRSGLNALLQTERSQVILNVMSQMKVAYRNVLTLRCFDQMSYAQIAAITGTTEAQAMLLFFRAKQSLKKQLARNGFKKEHLLPALGLFGAITASCAKPVSAVIPVSAAVTKVGLTVAAVGIATSKPGIIAVVATAVALSTAPATIKTAKIIKNNVYQRSSQKIIPLIKTKAFERPISLIQSYPDSSKWKGAKGSPYKMQILPTKSMSPQEVLVGPILRGYYTYHVLIIPAGHWLELGFSGEILDGRGIDICIDYRAPTGQAPLIFITDGAGQEVQLTSIHSYYDFPGRGCLFVGFDISDLSLPFEPRALRLVGTDDKGPRRGVEVCGVWARVNR